MTKSEIIKKVSSISLLLGFLIFIGSVYRMNTCGYDCGLFSVIGQPVTIVAWFIGVILAGLSMAVWLVAHWYSRTKITHNKPIKRD